MQYFVNLINDGTVLGSLSAMLSASTTNAIQALAQLVPSINNAGKKYDLFGPPPWNSITVLSFSFV